MTNNQAPLDKLDRMRLHGMARALRTIAWKPRPVHRRRVAAAGRLPLEAAPSGLIITGKCGSGKSFLASALGHQACLRGFRVGYHACSRLFGQLRLAKAAGSYVRNSRRSASRH